MFQIRFFKSELIIVPAAKRPGRLREPGRRIASSEPVADGSTAGRSACLHGRKWRRKEHAHEDFGRSVPPGLGVIILDGKTVQFRTPGAFGSAYSPRLQLASQYCVQYAKVKFRTFAASRPSASPVA
jgi:hypothetical protein